MSESSGRTSLSLTRCARTQERTQCVCVCEEWKEGSMAVRATVSRFPMDTDAREGSGLLWGVTVTPFAAVDENGQSPAYGSGGDLLPRCENCWAYFNTYCELEQWSWSCSLCGNLNGLSSTSIERYSRPQSCAEMMSSFVDLELPPRNSQCFRIRSLLRSYFAI